MQLRVAALVIGFLPSVSLAQSIEEACGDLTGANLGNCRVAQAKIQAQGLEGTMCSSTTCYTVLQCSGEDGDRRCAGEGFEITWKRTEWGAEVSVRDPNGAMSEFGRCGTCHWHDYSSGPITNIDLIGIGNGELYFAYSPPLD